jgi:hypothetical protein
MTKSDLEALAQARLDDAKLLLSMNRNSSAYYLSGYAVECALKACIAKSFQPNAIPSKSFVNAIYTHKLADLVGIAGLSANLDQDCKSNAVFAAAWGVASKWNEESRYKLWDAISAASMINSVADNNNGVFQWVKKYW